MFHGLHFSMILLIKLHFLDLASLLVAGESIADHIPELRLDPLIVLLVNALLHRLLQLAVIVLIFLCMLYLDRNRLCLDAVVKKDVLPAKTILPVRLKGAWGRRMQEQLRKHRADERGQAPAADGRGWP